MRLAESSHPRVHRALARLERVEVDAGDLGDVDTPEDLPDHR